MFSIISDSGCDFSKGEAMLYGIDIVPFYITFDRENHLREGIDINKEDYFKRLLAEKDLFPQTAQPNPQDYIDICLPYLKNGEDVFITTISSKLSGSFTSANIAVEFMKDEYPDRTIVIFDSLSASLGQGLILKEIIKMRDSGYSIRETARIAEYIRASTKIYFTLDTLEYLRRGGRVSSTAAFVGNALGIRPVLHLVDGQILQYNKVRGKKRVLKFIEEEVILRLKNEKHNLSLSIGHILNRDDATTLKECTEDTLNTSTSNSLVEVGACVGTHTGPGALALAYCKKYECFLFAQNEDLRAA